MLLNCLALAADMQIAGANKKSKKVPAALRNHVLTQKFIIAGIAAACIPE